MIASLAFAALLSAAPVQDAPIVTGAQPAETAEALRIREAVAYANPLPRGAPTEDFPLVAWCEALVSGHVRLGETLANPDDLDRDIMRLGRREAQDFQTAIRMSTSRQSAASRRAATEAAAEATGKWNVLIAQDEPTRNQSFGLFFGLPGRCEHAARRLRENITTPPATPVEVGLE